MFFFCLNCDRTVKAWDWMGQREWIGLGYDPGRIRTRYGCVDVVCHSSPSMTWFLAQLQNVAIVATCAIHTIWEAQLSVFLYWTNTNASKTVQINQCNLFIFQWNIVMEVKGTSSLCPGTETNGDDKKSITFHYWNTNSMMHTLSLQSTLCNTGIYVHVVTECLWGDSRCPSSENV